MSYEIPVPQEVYESDFEGGGDDWLPAKGEWQARIHSVYQYELGRQQNGDLFRGHATDDGEQVKILFTDFQSIDGKNENPHENRTWFAPALTIRDGDQTIATVDMAQPPDETDTPRLVKDTRRLAQLARQLGAPFTPDFPDQLVAGNFNGESVQLRVAGFRRDDGTMGAYVAKFGL